MSMELYVGVLASLFLYYWAYLDGSRDWLIVIGATCYLLFLSSVYLSVSNHSVKMAVRPSLTPGPRSLLGRVVS